MREDYVMVPGDGHVHTEWSWDAPHGSMERACARAVDRGLPTVAFTDHADFVEWTVSPGLAGFLRDLGATVGDGAFTPQPFDLDGYLECVQRCRDQFPDLEIQSGVELGEPHRFSAQAEALVDAGRFDVVVAAVHTLVSVDGHLIEVSDAYLERSARDVVTDYLAEVERLVTQWDRYDVLAHVDYAVRSWPPGEPAYRTRDFDDEYRSVLRALAVSGRALEVNTRLTFDPSIIQWWRQAGGRSVSFGSDVHDAHFLGQGFEPAAAMVADHGFGPDPARHGFWTLR
jgi:histidinol-phosphatase (PHP family)